MDKLEKFIEEAHKVHGDKYDYSKVNYVNNRTKICIICPEHGEFWQIPYSHLKGYGCVKCSAIKKSKDMTSNTIDFINKSKKIHNDKYDYSKVNYVDAKTKVCIICPEHGEFLQSPMGHLQGYGCPKCKNIKIKSCLSSDKETFVNKSQEIHNFKYDYSKVEYVNNKTKVCIICPEHGEFWQIPYSHLNGRGCPLCANKINGNRCRSNTEEFIKKSHEVHGEKYDYSNVKYVNNTKKVEIVCKKHGIFTQRPNDHLTGYGCPKCGQIMSKAEDEIVELLKPLECQQRNRIILDGKEIDIYIPSLKLGIEYNGLLWHSEKYNKSKYYHIGKLNGCNEQGIRLIQIFEDEWINNREICESKLKQICGLNSSPKIYGRKCKISLIKNKNDAYEFLDKNHIQGRTVFSIALGCYYQDKLVGIMCFKREKEGYWDLNRFATDINYQCVGIGGKLFKYFTTHYEFQEIKSFADRRWTTNPTDNLYTKLGFEFDSFVPPSYWYYSKSVNLYKRFHKFGFRKQILNKKYGLPLTMTELEMTKELGYTRIWDCGLIKYVYKKGLTT